jgi:formylglycine-generating enzyme required for sulfatase activity/dienelactone hydrolase
MPNQEQSAEQLFVTALELPRERRSAFLDDACRDAPELRRMVDALLTDHERARSFLEHSLVERESETHAAITATLDRFRGAGRKLGRYTLLEPMGSGGMGVVYRARDEKLERAVAVKILAPGVLTGPEARSRFRKEALALAKLNHEHIAAVYDVGEQDGIDYIVMECVGGESLAAKLKSGPLPMTEATSIALQIAQALEEAHESGVIHRDLKPANVMVTPKGNVKVLDFGLAKLLAPDATLTLTETNVLAGTPLYMSPEQAQGKSVDARTDLWSLGVVYYESLTGHAPFHAEGTVAVLRAIVDEELLPLRKCRPDLPPLADAITSRALDKEPSSRYSSASKMARDFAQVLRELNTTAEGGKTAKGLPRSLTIAAAVVLIAVAAWGYWLYHRASRRTWASEVAIPQINNLLSQRKPLAAFLLIQEAERYLPADEQLQQLLRENTLSASVSSEPAGATVQVQDYDTPGGPWLLLGVTPMAKITIPKGYFRWKVAKAGMDEWLTAPETDETMDFALGTALKTPRMGPVQGGKWADYVDFVGWLGPYALPSYYIDRYEVTNRGFQQFVDSGGYEKRQYWTEHFTRDGHELTWEEAMAQFRDTTGRPGPSTWVGGHYPEGTADFPVSGVSWFEASAYAAFVGKSLPVVAQWYRAAPPDLAQYTIPASNISSKALAAVGTYQGVGPYGTYDMAGNVSEWAENPVDNNLRILLGGSWKSPSYLYFDPEALSPFDRSETNGFRCVRNLGPLPAGAEGEVQHASRDFSKFKPVPESVFEAYKAMYAYPKLPLHARVEGIVKEIADWREQRVSFDTAYRGERMAAYLFLPKNVKPPYQTVLFFPSARVEFIDDNHNGRDLGDLKFFDYIVQSGRAVMYPIYQNTYERRVTFTLPGGSQNIELTTDWYKDAARSIDYLTTRTDIDSSRLAYLGVSMGSAEGVIAATLLQDRLKTAIFLDGGYFLSPPPPGGDQADFAPRMKKPVLMVNGRYDFTFSLDKAQNPLFAQLGSPDGDKRHVVLDTPHDVTDQRPVLVKAVLDWLDHYLGLVRE